jgi:TonB family protein
MSDYLSDIRRYRKGEMTPAEMHALEKRALSDPFLAEALEGVDQLSEAEFSEDVKQLNRRISGKKPATTRAWTMRIAAGLAILLAATFVIWKTGDSIQEPEELALEKTVPQPEPSETGDSIPKGILSQPATPSETGGLAARDQEASATPSKSKIVKPKEVQPESKTEEVKEDQKENEAQTPPVPTTEKPAGEVTDLEKKAEVAVQPKETSDLARRDSDDKQKSVSAGARAADVQQTVQVIRGKVTSSEDGSALPGVNVVIKGTTMGTVTDINGHYEIQSPMPQPTLVYSFIGLQTLEMDSEGRQVVDVQLGQDMTQLSEVVVTGYSIDQPFGSKIPTVDLAHPESGQRAFKQYLEKNIQYPEQALENKIEGRVTVEFFVETSGALSEFYVVRGIGYGCDEELIRLIKNGPKWAPTKKDDEPVRDKARVRLRFELPKK